MITLSSESSGLYTHLALKLKQIESAIKNNSKKSYIPFPLIFSKGFGATGISKNKMWEVLFLMKEFGLIEVIPFHGIRLKFEVKNEK
ncbi:MAG: hypothetical protein NTU63_01900 [Candidatus Pacearchaeota archaeon]|nr:hypothetical protein [Candidatus Pacearchaeota archaeon]